MFAASEAVDEIIVLNVRLFDVFIKTCIVVDSKDVYPSLSNVTRICRQVYEIRYRQH